MALTPTEKELLAVVRYFNEQVEKKNVAKLVNKLCRDFDTADVKALTGFGENEISVLRASLKPKPKSLTDRQVARIKKDAEKAIEELDNERLAIHLDANSNLPNRLAYHITKAIEDELNPGSLFWSKKELMQRLECQSATIGRVMPILKQHNWIIEAQPGNPRKGYVIR